MNRILIITVVFLIGLLSFKNSEKPLDKLQIAEKYFVALDESNSTKMEELLADSLITRVPKYEYEVRYSKSDYLKKWLKWDSIFDPTYEVLEMNVENESVKVKVSKSDERIFFFMQKPFITNEILKFKEDKIIAIETEYINFDEVTWEKNRTELINWTTKNYPELNLGHFINVQTEYGGKKFLKAIKLYINKNK
ncbi:hypothetical protein ACE939_03115 [Aquimarina sp. W85]|uniref:hypothetical protein n=1 Tax=Aquimarina rhodophyticola TaxID=3342246 RepID=UPI003670CF0F